MRASISRTGINNPMTRLERLPTAATPPTNGEIRRTQAARTAPLTSTSLHLHRMHHRNKISERSMASMALEERLNFKARFWRSTVTTLLPKGKPITVNQAQAITTAMASKLTILLRMFRRIELLRRRPKRYSPKYSRSPCPLLSAESLRSPITARNVGVGSRDGSAGHSGNHNGDGIKSTEEGDRTSLFGTHR